MYSWSRVPLGTGDNLHIISLTFSLSSIIDIIEPNEIDILLCWAIVNSESVASYKR